MFITQKYINRKFPGGAAGKGSGMVTGELGCWCGAGSIPGPGTSTCQSWSQKKIKQQQQKNVCVGGCVYRYIDI